MDRPPGYDVAGPAEDGVRRKAPPGSVLSRLGGRVLPASTDEGWKPVSAESDEEDAAERAGADGDVGMDAVRVCFLCALLYASRIGFRATPYG